MLPTRLWAPAPGWHAETDVVIVGSGIAGLSTALQIARQSPLRVLVVTKDVLAAGSTRWAQVASPRPWVSAIAQGSTSPTRLPRATGSVTRRQCASWFGGPGRGPRPGLHRRPVLTAPGRAAGPDARGRSPSRPRCARGGDATGAEIERALEARLLSASGVDVIEHAVVLDLLRDAARCGL